MSLVDELADECELRRGTGEAVGLRWEAGDSADERRRLINTQHQVADVLAKRGWRVEVGVERPSPDVEIFAVRIADDPDLLLSDQLE